MSAEMNTTTPVTLMMEQLKTLSFTDLLTFQLALASHIKSEFKKVTKKAKKVKNPDAPKRPLNPGMLAWKAYVKHLQTTKPEMFEGAKVTQKQTIASEYKKEHMEEYDAFVKAFVPPVVEAPVIVTEVSTSNASENPKKEKKVKSDKPESESDKPKKTKTKVTQDD